VGFISMAMAPPDYAARSRVRLKMRPDPSQFSGQEGAVTLTLRDWLGVGPFWELVRLRSARRGAIGCCQLPFNPDSTPLGDWGWTEAAKIGKLWSGKSLGRSVGSGRSAGALHDLGGQVGQFGFARII
jgi:hypothetical protein